MAQKRKLDLTGIPLREVEIEAIRAFKQMVRSGYPDIVTQFALFGSKARGDSRLDSDVDILIIITEEDREVRAGIIDIASDVSLRYDVLISPRIIGSARWEAHKDYLVYRQILEDAVPITG